MTRFMQDLVSISRSALVILLLAGATSQLSAADDVSGEWELQMERNGLTTYATLTIARAADGKLTGKWGTNDLADVKFEGQKLTFGRTLRLGDQEFTMNYEGTLKDGALTGTLSSERGNFPANGARPRARHSALGRWELKYTIGDRDIIAVLAISQKTDGSLDATWTNTAAEHVVSDVKLEGQKLTLARKSKVQDREFESTYEATIDGHKLTGTIKSPLGEVPANGTRIGADLVGKWELATSSERGPRTSMLTVFGDLTGRYELFGSEIPFKDLKLDGGQVSFSLEVGFGDQTFTLDFKGKLEGKTLTGEVTSPRGSRAVTGKKIESVAASPFVGTWEITREGNQGTRTATLTIKGDMTASYTVGENSTAVTDLRAEGDQLSFKATMKRGERDVQLEFKGKLEGSTLKGQVITPRGTREATGKRVEAAPSAKPRTTTL